DVSNGIIRQSEVRVGDRYDVHRIEQAIFPRQFERELCADIEFTLQNRLRHQRTDAQFVADFVSLDDRADSRTEHFDLALIARLDGRRRILVSAGETLDPLNRWQREDIRALDLNRVPVPFLVDE